MIHSAWAGRPVWTALWYRVRGFAEQFEEIVRPTTGMDGCGALSEAFGGGRGKLIVNSSSVDEKRVFPAIQGITRMT
ncbi:hypothetical protein GCM10010428_79230 [Actinosynnema pretiosum subsp. pretiosum]